MNKNAKILNECGQIVLVLILVMTVALAVGIAVIQRSLSDISTASKVEQSSRAFSAAEAGIEKTLTRSASQTTTSLSFSQNNSQASAEDKGLVPVAVTAVGSRQNPIEYFPFSKEEVAQVWLADFTSFTNPPTQVYKQSSIDVYWGNSSSDKAALELTLVYYNGSIYTSRKWYLDQIARPTDNKFCQVSGCTLSGYNVGANNYKCKFTLGDNSTCTVTPAGFDNSALPVTSPNILMLIRARLLYTTTSQPFAVQAITCAASPCIDYSIPPQSRIIQSTGTAGTTQRKVRLQQMLKVAPLYLDYAIFSSDTIAK